MYWSLQWSAVYAAIDASPSLQAQRKQVEATGVRIEDFMYEIPINKSGSRLAGYDAFKAKYVAALNGPAAEAIVSAVVSKIESGQIAPTAQSIKAEVSSMAPSAGFQFDVSTIAYAVGGLALVGAGFMAFRK
jgi:hypothetical protein